ncbi:alpha-ketoglutarate-dependent dioxygenase AlkB [Allosphingosinicella deserti]|uniref:Alpha-ketoglutarate-dependent dioxygenase AlkB n=1 Tax=Allosphingosinicella deserti TaxID=2116704 RepID=A0A2P7QR06_9SPHN|nr:alpha-ketoglutarate-dependent dioxygenase AlkB [Sphingomonas deserti]PSJ40380.1 alpha-ketoglutarate-dependent dioxygenase AlkB [Sphingomonas deserti]
MAQLNLFGGPTPPALPAGLVYGEALITPAEEQDLVARLADLPFQAFEFQNYLGNRRTVSFGWHYAFDGSGLHEAEPMPDWLFPVRDRAAVFAGIEGAALVHALIIEYAPGAGIGWHRDKPVFGDVLGVSLLARARLRFRRRQGDRWERANVIAAPRSVYLLRGPARDEWEHSIPVMEELRYSITFRTLRRKADQG